MSFEELEESAFAVDTKLLRSATFNSVVSPEGDRDFQKVESSLDHRYQFMLSDNERALFNRIYMDGTAETLGSMEIRGGRLVRGETRIHPDHADCLGVMMPMFMNRSIRIKETFEKYRRNEPEHRVLMTTIGPFVAMATQQGFLVDPINPNYGGANQARDEASLFIRFPKAFEVQSFDIAVHSGNLVDLNDLKRGYSNKLVLAHPEPFVRAKVHLLNEKSYLVITEIITYPQNVLRYEGRNAYDYRESLFKAPKSFETAALELLLGKPGDMASVLGILEYLPSFHLAYIKPGLRVHNPISVENMLNNQKGFHGIDTIGQL